MVRSVPFLSLQLLFQLLISWKSKSWHAFSREETPEEKQTSIELFALMASVPGQLNGKNLIGYSLGRLWLCARLQEFQLRQPQRSWGVKSLKVL